MTSRWDLLTGEYPPECGGIGQYAFVMAHALADIGVDVHVWTPAGRSSSGRVTVHALPDHFGSRSIAAFDANVQAISGRVVLHYTPNALGARGANLRFCRWFASRARRTWDTRVFFHEPFMYFGRQSLARNLLAAMHRVMAATLLRAGDEVYLSTPSWQPLLERYSTREHHWRWIPITVGAPPRATRAAAAARRARFGGGSRSLVGTFGTYARETAGVVRAAIGATLIACPDAHVVCLGRNSREFVASLDGAPRVSASGELAEDELSAAIAACDLMLQPFPEGVTCRRTSLLRTLATGAAVITTSGRRTEPLWNDTAAVSLVPAHDPDAIAVNAAALLGDPAARARLREGGSRAYESFFSPHAMVRALDPWNPASCASCS